MNDIPYVQIIVAVLAVGLVLTMQARSRKKKARILATIKGGAKVIDVRSPGEYSSGHFQGAINIPVDKLESKLKSIGTKDQAVVVYCASGARSAAAERTLRAAGFQNVLNAGSISAMPSI